MSSSDERIDAKRKRTEPSAATLPPPILDHYAPYTERQIEIRVHHNHAQNWDTYYRNNQTKGYKDRHYILREFSELSTALESGSPVELLEIGCGVGNTFFPLLDHFCAPRFTAYGFDISRVAVDLLVQTAAERGVADRVHVTVCDLARESPPRGFLDHPITFASLVFVLCSVEPSQHQSFLKRAFELVAPEGTLFFRDYCKEDLAERRFVAGGNAVDGDLDSTYARANGTLSHFFDVDETRELFTSVGFEVVELGVVEREVENRRQGLSMNRRWIQGRFRKPRPS